MRTVIWILMVVAVYGMLALLASRSVYFPMRYPAGNWDVQRAIGADDVHIGSLHAWFIAAPSSNYVTLHLHGNAGNITHRTLAARHIVDAGSSVLLLDYRGYGRSEGRPTERGLYEDAEAAYGHLLSRGFKPGQIVLHGESLGTAVAVNLASRRPCAGVVLEAPFPSARAVAGRVLPWIGPLLISGFETRTKLADVNVPVLVIHGDRDEVIAYEFGQQVFQAAREPKQMWTLRGATHNDLHLMGDAEFSQRLRAFYASLVSLQ